MNRPQIFTILSITVLIASCTHSTDANGGGSIGIWTIPGTGTQYVFRELTGDSILTPTDTIQYQVYSTGQTLNGQSNVETLLVTYSNGDVSPQYFAYEPNGDLLVNQSNNNSVGPTWIPASTGSHQVLSSKTTDTSNASLGITIVDIDTNSYIGAETLSTAIGNFSTIHIRSAVLHNVFDLVGDNDTSFDTTDYWFAPSAGFFVKEFEHDNIDNGVSSFNTETDLIKYLPK
jgi:hypothetical protein